jgi:ABC-type nickel/cobalt efflux system permease component RcnA
MTRSRLLAVGTVGLGLLLAPSPAPAHPMGNFSVSHYSSLTIEEQTIELRHVVDMAEIPTFQEIQDTAIVPDVAHPSVAAYLARKAETLKEGLRVELDGHRLELRVISHEIIFPPGAGGLPTLKLGIRYRAVLVPGAANGVHELRFRDDNLPDRTGWKEIVAVPGNGIEFASSSVPGTDRSAALSDYPSDPLSNPPQALEAHVRFTRVGTMLGKPAPAAKVPAQSEIASRSLKLEPNRQAPPRNGLTDIVATRQTGLVIVLLAAVVAVGLGALHALEPGHGKTVVAAYLVGSRGTAWHALVLGLTATLSHTAGVYVLGGLTLYASRYVVPERLYPWLAVASGLMIAGLGVLLLWQRYSAAGQTHTHEHRHVPDEFHDHAHGHDHDVVGHHSHTAGHTHHAHAPRRTSAVALRDLIALGVSGGIVPCPAALVVLLSAVSLGRTGFGLFLIVAFSVGLAGVLVAIGLLIVYARQRITRFKSDGVLVTRWLPLASAAVVTLLGVAIVLNAVRA